MGVRRTGRMVAVQVLYQLDTGGGFDNVEVVLGRHFDVLDPTIKDEARAFAEHLARGVATRLDEIDRVVGEASQNWRVDRMARVDRNILRLAVFELLDRTDVPPSAVINEAIEIGKTLGTAESAPFINGVLDRALRDLHPPD